MLLARKRLVNGSKCLFPGSCKSGHIITIQHAHEKAIGSSARDPDAKALKILVECRPYSANKTLSFQSEAFAASGSFGREASFEQSSQHADGSVHATPLALRPFVQLLVDQPQKLALRLSA